MIKKSVQQEFKRGSSEYSSFEVVSVDNLPLTKKPGEKLDSKNVSLTIVFSVLYAIGVITLAPISFSIYQIRVADALLPLSMIFGVPSAIGLSLGCLVANVYGGFGLVDIIGGSAANLAACTLAWYVAKNRGMTHRVLGSIIETIIITLIVGGYLSFLLKVPLEFGLFNVFVGSLIAVNIIGFTIEEILLRSSIVKSRYLTEKGRQAS